MLEQRARHAHVAPLGRDVERRLIRLCGADVGVGIPQLTQRVHDGRGADEHAHVEWRVALVLALSQRLVDIQVAHSTAP